LKGDLGYHQVLHHLVEMEARQEGMEASLGIQGEEVPSLEAGRVGHQGDPCQVVEYHRAHQEGTEGAGTQGGHQNQEAAQIRAHWV